jgi:hypothetical protein
MSTNNEIQVDPERKNHKGQQYLYDGITGRYTYFPAGTFQDSEKLAELNASQRKVYRDRQNLLFPRIGTRREGLIVVSDVDEVEVDEAKEKEKELDDYEANRLFQNEARRKLRVGKLILSKPAYMLYRKVCVLELFSLTEYAKREGLSLSDVSEKAALAKSKVEAALKKPK